MNKTKRLIIQSLLWLVVWIILWINSQNDDDFFTINSVAFVFQIALISTLIFYTAPKLLLKKKYLMFALFSFVVVFISVYISSKLFFNPPINQLHPIEPPHPMGHPAGPMKEPSPAPSPRIIINTLMLSISYILAILIETFLFVKKKEEEVIITKNENLQNELKLLKSQINPHFLFNSLNNIYALAAIDSGKTQKSIIHLSDMLRYVLYECDQETVPLKKEVEYIENYLKLFALKSSKSYPISTEFNIFNKDVSIAPMLLIPFVENAIKHSNIDDRKNSFINIKINVDLNNIDFEIENSKPKKTIIKDGVGGIGLENVKKRLAILYREKHDLKISETDTAFKVNLLLELV